MRTVTSGNIGQEAREKMGASKDRMATMRRIAILAFVLLATMLMLAPAGADARKIGNPSPPDFYGELTGGFLQLSGAGGTKIFQLSLDFESLGVAKPSFRGTIDSAGNINVPQSQLVFPPLQFEIPPDTVNVTLLPTAPATGKIDPLTGRVDFRIRLRIQATGAAQGVSLGGSCFVGSAGSPIDIDGRTHYGTFPDVSGGIYVADFLPSPADSFLGGLMPATPYSDETGVWEDSPRPGGVGYNFKPRAAGSFRIANETLRAVAATGCGPLGLANGPINDQLGLPSDPGASSAVLEFAFVAGGSRVGPNAIVQKGVKSNFTAPGVSTPTWPSTETPILPTTVPATIDASSSIFSAGPNAGGRYAYDLGTGTFGSFTNTAVQPISFPTPGIRTIRVQARDADGDIDVKTRTIEVVPSTDIAVSSSALGGEFRGGSPGTLRSVVSNTSATRANTQPIVVTTDIPASTSFSSISAASPWSCGFSSPTVTCTLPTGALAAGASSNLDLNLDVGAAASNPLSSTVNAVQSGDPNPANNSATAVVPVKKTDLTVAIAHSGDVVANGTVAHTVDVSNVGDAATVGSSTVSITLPPLVSFRNAGSGGPGWSCVSGPTPQDVTCTRTAVIAASSAAPAFTIVAKVDRTATGTVVTSATVSAQGDTNAFGGSNTDTDDVLVLVLPDLALESSVSADFIVGDPGTLILKVENQSVVNTPGPTAVTSTLPTGLTVSSASGTGWDCTATTPGSSAVDCVYAADLAGGEFAPDLTVQLAVDHGAYPSASIDSVLSNTADAYAPNNPSSVSTSVKRLDVAITKTAVRSFSVGLEGQYRLSVSNPGDADTVGPVTVLDTLPPELKLRSATGGGWNCSASVVGGQHVECVLSSAIPAGGAAAVISVKVDVLDAAADAGEVVNTATVDTARDNRAVAADDPVNGNNSATATTKAVSVDLSIESTHGSVFRVGTTQQYSLKIRNVGIFPTLPGQPVTVTDQFPVGMAPDVGGIFTDRPGWTCSAVDRLVTCVLEAPSPSGSAMLAGQTATIEIPVAVTDPAVNPSLNVAEISTEKDNSVERSPNNRSEDSTVVTRIDLGTAASVSIQPRAGGIGEVSIDVSNNGSAATVATTVVTVPLAPSVAYRPTGSTIVGWNCSSPGSGTQITCNRAPSIPAGAAAPPLRLRTNVAASAPASWFTAVTVRTSGEAPERLADNDVSLSQTLQKVDLTISKSHVPGSIKAGLTGQYRLGVANTGNVASTGTTTVTETVSAPFTNIVGTGSGWNCQAAGQDLTCNRISPIPAGSATPDITVNFDVALDASGTRNSIATVSNPSDPYLLNNTADGPIIIVASADVEVSIDQPTDMRVGDISSIAYQVRNIGTESTSGSPSVSLKVTMAPGLEPFASNSADDWDCSQQLASEGQFANIDCVLGSDLAPGEASTLNAQVRVVPTDQTQTGTFARVISPGDVYRPNDSALALSDVSGIDLSAALFAPITDLEADVVRPRLVNITNQGTAATTGPVTVRVPLPDGVQWSDTPPYGTGWACALPVGPVRTVVCDRSDVTLAAAAVPPLRIDLKPSRSNAPSITVDYTVETEGDSDDSDNTVSRTDTVLYKPETTVTSKPSATTTARTATVEFTSDDPTATFECKLDLAAFAPCTSPVNLTGVPLGGHSFAVQARNTSNMVDPTPAEANWTVIADDPVGNSVPIKASLTGGSLSLAALGTVPLPGGQLIMDGSLFENGAWAVPQAGVNFLPIEQTLDAPGIGQVTVKISIQATGPGSGSLPNGGGAASFNLPVQAKLEALLGTIPLIGPDADCFLRPIQFDLAGTYDETAKTTTVSSPSVTFPTVSAGCGALGGTVNGLLELPRSDIAIALDFALEKGSAGEPMIAKPKVRAPKSVKSGKPVTLRVSVPNTGDAAATGVKVCLKSPTRLVRGKGTQCLTFTSIAPGSSAKARFKVRTKKIRKGKKAKKARFTIDVSYVPVEGAARKHTKTGHVTLLR